MKKRFIIFDLWRTLCYRTSIVGEINKQFFLDFSYRESVDRFENAIQTKQWDSLESMFRALALAFGLAPTKEVVDRLTLIFDHAYDRFQEFSHVQHMLEKLQKQGFSLGLISNSSDYAITLLRRHSNLLDHFDHIAFSYAIGAIKPNPHVYHALLQKAKVRPSEALMIGDKPTEDVDVPRSLGIDALQYTDYDSLQTKGKKEYHITF